MLAWVAASSHVWLICQHFKRKARNSFITVICIATLSIFCTAVGILEASEFSGQVFYFQCFQLWPFQNSFKCSLCSHCNYIEVLYGEGAEAIFSWPQLAISLSSWSMTFDIFGHLSLARVVLDTILIHTNASSSFCCLSWLCQRISELKRDEEQGRQCSDAVWLMLLFFLP